MQHNTLHFPILKEIGLSENEALIYELLVELGPNKASDLVDPSGIGRGNVYNVLQQLQAKGLVIVREGKFQIYEATDPSALESLLERKREEMKQTESAFSLALRDLNSHFNLSTGKPAIQIFEGLDGAKKALHQSLESKKEILTYVDIHAINGLAADINKGYLKKRIEKKIQKRLLVADVPEAHAFFENQKTPFTKVAFVKDYPEQFATAMEMYDNTVTYLTLNKEKNISVIIRDPSIYAFHKQQFEFLWNRASQIIDYAALEIDGTEKTRGSNAT
ncbi:MAG: hypothetical protein NUV81_03945 [bacterium]|nr:hypothetical protein [bacterium]